ncbi:RNA methyltransferase [Desulfonatronovibrio magnus]|uniref:RNA methyltransferase n=1 Tax=Desulfonatronovibrio magnus TaxID=698827 RepID=UPI0005EB0795|nr:RNA methyltransferase [Desulfonatronovibrio magnus]
MLTHVSVVLCRPKFSENIGSVARACVNMGCSSLVLVSPRSFDLKKAAPLATSKGKVLIEQAQVHDSLETALKDFHRVYATTARVGKWRKGILNPWEAAQSIMDVEKSTPSCALVFGPEDKGLTNEEVELCSHIISIPTSKEAWSLNLAQAVLIVLYECFKLIPASDCRQIKPGDSRLITRQESMILNQNIREALLTIDFLDQDNPDYFMMPLKRLLSKKDLRHHEFNLLMGICRQIKWMAHKNNQGPQ